MSLRSEARNLDFNKFRDLRFLTYVRNDIFYYCDTVSRPGLVPFRVNPEIFNTMKAGIGEGLRGSLVTNFKSKDATPFFVP
jgi:hypothetical protein